MNDTIYRQAAIDTMCAACWDWCDEGVCKRVSALQQLPSADTDLSAYSDKLWRAAYERGKREAERMRGKWIDRSGGIEGAWNYCSVCGEQAIDLYDFCPNCGADMRGE